MKHRSVWCYIFTCFSLETIVIISGTYVNIWSPGIRQIPGLPEYYPLITFDYSNFMIFHSEVVEYLVMCYKVILTIFGHSVTGFDRASNGWCRNHFFLCLMTAWASWFFLIQKWIDIILFPSSSFWCQIRIRSKSALSLVIHNAFISLTWELNSLKIYRFLQLLQ